MTTFTVVDRPASAAPDLRVDKIEELRALTTKIRKWGRGLGGAAAASLLALRLLRDSETAGVTATVMSVVVIAALAAATIPLWVWRRKIVALERELGFIGAAARAGPPEDPRTAYAQLRHRLVVLNTVLFSTFFGGLAAFAWMAGADAPAALGGVLVLVWLATFVVLLILTVRSGRRGRTVARQLGLVP